MNYRKKIKNVSKKDCRGSGGPFVVGKNIPEEFYCYICFSTAG